MGACSFITSMAGKNMQDAYYKAVEMAKLYQGEDPYNGTISTTRGFIDKTKAFEQSACATVDQYIEISFDDTEKWGPAFGIKRKLDYIFWGTAAE